MVMSSESRFDESRAPIPLSVPWITGNEAAYLSECVDTNWVSSGGGFVKRFEKDVAGRLGCAHAVATVNGTAALHTALMVAGVRPGDCVLTSTLTFVATANAIRHAGAWPVFIDVDPATWQIDAGLVADFLATACEVREGALAERTTGRRVGAVLPVHILGHPADMDPIVAAARSYDLPVIEDATESLGATYRGRKAGNLADVACLSFNGNKLITCGGGGMVVTDRADWAERAVHLTTQARCDDIEAIHDEVGFNYRLTNLQAAVGCAQLENLDERLAIKRRIATGYRDFCDATPGLSFMPEAEWAESALWMSTIRVDPEVFGCSRYDLLRILAENSIETRPLWQPLHLSPAYQGARVVNGAVAEKLYAQALSLPCSCSLTEADQGRIYSAILAAPAKMAE